MYQICKELDPTRFYDTTSGWFSQKNSDVVSRHIYFRNKILSTNLERPLLLSECGGYTRPINNHLNSNKKQYGYGKTNSEKELTDKLKKCTKKWLYHQLIMDFAVVFILKYLILKTKSMAYILMIGKSVKSISKE